MKGYNNLVTICDYYDELAEVQLQISNPNISAKKRGEFITYSRKLQREINYFTGQKATLRGKMQ